MNIDQIIAKVFAGKASQEELEQLNTWKSEAQENIKAIKEMQGIDSIVNEMSEYKNFDVDSAWDKFNIVVKQDNEQKAQVRKMPWLRVAAAASVLFLFSFVAYQWLGNQSLLTDVETEFVSNEKILDAGLADGSQIKLDKNSSLTTLSKRSVSMTGRAYFDISKVDGDLFTIALPEGKVTVFGTKFTIDARGNTVIVYVSEGKVRFDHQNRKVSLEAGEMLTLSNGDISKVKSDGQDVNYWMLHKLSFRNESLVSVVATLNHHYSRKIVIDNLKMASKCMVNTTIESESIDEILSELAQILSLKYHLKEETIHIVAANC